MEIINTVGLKKKDGNIFIIAAVMLTMFIGCSDNKLETSGVASLHEIESLLYYHPKQAEIKLDSLHVTISPKEYQQHTAYILYLQGFLLYQKGMLDSTITTLDQSLTAFVNLEDLVGQGKCHLLLGWVAEGLGQWEQAKINYYSTLNFLDGQTTLIAGLAYLGIARCKFYLNEAVADEIKKSNQLLLKTGSDNHRIHGRYISTLLKKDFSRDDIEKLKAIAADFVSAGLNNNAANAYKNVAIKYQEIDEIDTALLYIDKAIVCNMDIYPGVSEAPALYQVKGMLYYLEHNNELAITYLLKALELYDKYKLEERKYYAYTYLRRIAVENKNYTLAYGYSEKASLAQKRIHTINKARVAKLMEISFNVHQLEALISQLKRQRKISILLMVLGLTIIFLFVRLIIKGNELKQEKLRRKNTELQNLVIGMNEKILMQRRLGISYETSSLDNKTLKTLSYKFDESYRETLNFFLLEYETLTNSEARYALMLALGLNNDTICAVQSVQKSAVRKAKQRICNKLNIAPDQDLEVYFKNFLKRATPFVSYPETN